MPDLQGRVAVVTGANSGIGLVAAQEMARAGATVVMACRDLGKAESAASVIRNAVPDADLRLEQLDLSDLQSIEGFARRTAHSSPGLDLLINNAGVMATPKRQTADGFELQFGTNHLGHFALTMRLVPLLLQASTPRVVTVSSLAHRMSGIDFDDLMMDRRYARWQAYGQSKLANLLFAFELDRRMRSKGSALLSMAAHPGYTATHLQSSGPAMGGGIAARINTAGARLGNLLIGQDVAMGALPTLYAATLSDLPGGSYVGPGGLFEARGVPQVVEPRKLARNETVARRLWEESERLTGLELTLPV